MITNRIGLGARGFTEHVVRIGVTRFFELARIAQPFVDSLAENELPPEQLHRLRHGGSHQRLTGPAYEAAQHRCRLVRIIFQHLAG